MSIDNLFEKVKTKVDKKNEEGKFKNFDDLTARCEHAVTQLDRIQNNTYFKMKL